MWFLRTGEILWILFLGFNQLFLIQGTRLCRKTFRQSFAPFSITCPKECTSWPFSNQNVVFGTSVYHPDSLICLSALHAGVARIGAATQLNFIHTATQESFVGTISNRVISGIKGADVGFRFNNERFIQTYHADTEELVMVHNNNQQHFGSDVYVACLPNSQETLRNLYAEPLITRWNYGKQNYDEIFVDSEYASIQALRVGAKRDTRVLRCIGSNLELDITAILGFIDDYFESISPTVTASLEESVRLRYIDRNPSYDFIPIRLPTSPISGTVKGSDIDIPSVSLSDQGLYNGNNNYQAFSRLIVRGCKKDRNGANCSGWCRDCLNNGECDSDTGECVCSSGTRGKNCQIFCPANKFGAECHLDCDRIHSLWKSVRGTCKGLTFCLRDPKGCSCQPGYMPPRCTTECDAGSYGPDCRSRCNYCNGGTCDSYGRCDQGCKNANLCNEDKAPLNLPRFRKPPLITDCDVRGFAVTFSEWDSDYDDGELSDTDGELRYEISIENPSNSSENSYIPTYPGQQREFSYNFFGGTPYIIKLNILTNRGKATEEYNMRIQNIHLPILPCLAPGKPTLMPINALNEIDVVVTTSQYLSEQPSCWTSLHKGSLLQQNISKAQVIPQKEYTFSFTGLRPSSKYQVKSGCCNVKACSRVAEIATNTKLAEPVITDKFLLGTITSTTIVIKIPRIESGDSIIGYGEGRMNFTDLYDEYKRTRMRKKRSGEEESGTKSYVAGVVENEREFMVGSGNQPNNPPLVRGEVYSIIPLIELKLNNDRLVVEEPRITFTAGGSLHQPNQYLWIVPLLVILVVIALLLIGTVVYRKKRAVRRTPDEDKKTQNKEFKSTLYENPIADIQLEEIEDESVSFLNLEGYLHSLINSIGAIEKFMKIPKCYPKPTSKGESSENRRKNRCMNNLPYDETRVHLKIQEGDPSSDYINANHITSVLNNRRYIASQGPKDCNDGTIADFWRMVIEQEVNVIIMVANFIEKGIAKVGEYMCPEFPLRIQSLKGVISVVKQEITSFCTISTIQVSILVSEEYVQREVTHYHFSLWPDHGVPTEPRTLSQMILHIAIRHDNIHAVVHGLEGMGRTGTVLFCLICHDYLRINMPLNIFKVIRQLRTDRGRLIENQVQFMLCLTLLDEMMFGTQNSFPVSEIRGKLQSSKKDSFENYKRLAKLPNSLNCSTASHPENLVHNRNYQYLAPDFHRVNIQGSNGEMIYINAVKFQGLKNGVEYIATQHPFKNDLDKFWNLVHTIKSSKIVVLNKEFDEKFPEFYPSVVDRSFEVNNNVIKCTRRYSLSPNLIESEITVDSRNEEAQAINIYEVQNWKRGVPHPRDLSELVEVADILLSRVNDTPPLFVCGDGVTACGLMIGIINTIDRLKMFQDIDVYRTAVMLRRCHPTVIVDQSQLVKMMVSAKIFNENYNINDKL